MPSPVRADPPPGAAGPGPAGTSPAPAPALELLARDIAQRFGLDLSRYPRGTAESLAESLAAAGTDVTAGLSSAPPLRRVLSTCCIGETTFLRHPEQFAALRALLPTLPAERGGQPIRAWSAGCSTGEEAYSIAATLLPGASAPPQVLGTDLSPVAIATARRGRYRAWSLRGVDLTNPAVAAWLSQDRAGDVTVSPAVRARVDFAVHNLVDGLYPRELDVVLCRNVLLYFKPQAAKAVLARLADSVRVGGLLFLGGTDPVPATGPYAAWRAETCGDATFYRRVALPGEADPAPPPPRPPSRPPYTQRPPEATGELVVPLTFDAELVQARALASQRSFSAALVLLDRLCRESALAVEPHVLTALVAEEAGQAELALAAARRACFLAPHAPAPRCLLAQCLLRVGAHAQAAQQFALAAAQLPEGAASGDLELQYGEGLTASQLRRMIDVHVNRPKDPGRRHG